jgi:hypothetical protein
MVFGAESAFPPSMCPGALFVKARVIAALVVADPHSPAIHVRGIGMSGLIAVVAAAIILIVAALVVIALVYPVLVRLGLFGAGLLGPALVLTGSAVIGFRAALRRRSDRMGGWVVICLILVLVFLRKCRG